MINVLDYGHVRLFEHMGSDLSVVRNARVSYNAERRTSLPGEEDKDEKLINFLLKNKHTSPFESVQFTFDVKCPIFVARQWIRHRTWSYNEVSARYTELPKDMYMVAPKDLGIQSSSNKQMRDMKKWEDMSVAEIADAFFICSEIAKSNQASYDEYKKLINKGVPRELARGVLPLNIYTHFFATVDLHNLMHFLKLRLHEHAQYEIRVYAKAILQLIEPIVPMCVGAFRKHILG